MSEHRHSVYVEGCFRCDLSREESREWRLSRRFGRSRTAVEDAIDRAKAKRREAKR